MNQYLPDLISLYAQHGVQVLEANASMFTNTFGKTIEELSRDPVFPLAKKLVRDMQRMVEGEKSLVSPIRKIEISESLKLLLQCGMFEQASEQRTAKLDVLRQLLEKRFAQNWSPPQKQHFEFIFSRIKEWDSYFLSYTNFGARDINETYKKVINRIVGPEVVKARNWDEDNLLAEAVVLQMRTQQVTRAFYDRAKIKLGDYLEGKIKLGCDRTFTFLQLVQLTTFDGTREVNWCYEEYTTFFNVNDQQINQQQQYRDTFLKRFSAVLTSDDETQLRPPLVRYDYKPWAEQIFKKKLYVTLPREPEAFKKTIRDIADAVINLKFQLIEAVPD